MVSGRTRVMAILGDPVAQVRTPELVNDECARRGLDAVLVPFRVPAGGLAPVLAGLRGIENLCGAVVTMPHKRAAAQLVDLPSEAVTRVGACNVVRFAADGCAGDLTDGWALLAALRGAGADLHGAEVFLAGAGGAAAAIAHALAAAGVERLTLHNRTRTRAEQLAGSLRAVWPGLAVELGGPGVGTAHVVIDATPAGLPGAGPPLALDVTTLVPGSIVADIAITPTSTTPLLDRARRLSCRVVTGTDMLCAQVGAFVDYMAAGR